MSAATLVRTAPVPLPQLVDGIAQRTGAWVIVEQLGTVVAHGTGRTPCPAALAESVLGKSTAPLRAAISWSRSSSGLQGRVDDVAVAAAELGDGATAWFLGAPIADTDADALRASVRDDSAPVTDPLVEDLLHPRGPARPGRAPSALLLVLRADAPLGVLGRAALAAAPEGRVHTDRNAVVVALDPEADAERVVVDVRRRCPDAVAGAANVPLDAADWSATAHVATGCVRAATRLGRTLARAADPAVAAELVVDEAQAAAESLTTQVRSPLHRLQEYDARSNSELVHTLTAWCQTGFDTAAAASALHLHTNTLRYRLRRAEEIGGLDFDHPRQRLALQLLLAV